MKFFNSSDLQSKFTPNAVALRVRVTVETVVEQEDNTGISWSAEMLILTF